MLGLAVSWGEGSGSVALDAGCCSGLTERGKGLLQGECPVARGAADDVQERGARLAGAVGQVLDCPCRRAFVRGGACSRQTAGRDVLVGDIGYRACVCGTYPDSLLGRFDGAIYAVLPHQNPYLVEPAALHLSAGMEPSTNVLAVGENDEDRWRAVGCPSLVRVNRSCPFARMTSQVFPPVTTISCRPA